jgi:hypothetical protein
LLSARFGEDYQRGVELRVICRDANVWLKVAAGLIAFAVAWLWYQSATAYDPAAAIDRNVYAAIATGLAALGQGIAVIVDAWVPPSASWG